MARRRNKNQATTASRSTRSQTRGALRSAELESISSPATDVQTVASSEMQLQLVTPTFTPQHQSKSQTITSPSMQQTHAPLSTHQQTIASPVTLPEPVIPSLLSRYRRKKRTIPSRFTQPQSFPSPATQQEPAPPPSSQVQIVSLPSPSTQPQTVGSASNESRGFDSSTEPEDLASPSNEPQNIASPSPQPEHVDDGLSRQNSESIEESSLAFLVQEINRTASSSGRNSGRKRTRGRTRNLQLLLLPPGQKLPLEFNDLGQPIGPNASIFANCIGTHVRNYTDAPISFLRWESVPEENRERIYKRVVEKFDFVETPLIKERIMQKMGKKYADNKYQLKRNYYDKYETTEDRLKHIPEGMKKEDWAVFIEYHDMEETKEQCTRNKSNRAKQVITRFTGSKSYAQIRAEEAQKDPEHREPTQWKMFCIANTKNGMLGSSAAREILDKFENFASQMEESYSSMGEDEIYHQIVGPERHGRVRGFGFGPTPSAVFGTGPSRTDLAGQLKEANTHNDELKAKIRELERQIEEDRRKMEEERKKAEEDRKKADEVRKKMDTLVAFMEDMRKLA